MIRLNFTFISNKDVVVSTKINHNHKGDVILTFRDIETKKLLHRVVNPKLELHVRLITVITMCKQIFDEFESKILAEYDYEFHVSLPVKLDFSFITKAKNYKTAVKELEKKLENCEIKVNQFSESTFIYKGKYEILGQNVNGEEIM